MNFLFYCAQNTLSTLKKHILCLALFLIMFVIGIMCGIIIKQPESIEEYYARYAEEYVGRIYIGSIGGILADRLLGAVVFFAASVLTACFVWFIPLQVFFVFYKGFVFGATTEILFAVYGFGGCLVFLTVLLWQTLILAFGYAVTSVCVFDFGKNRGIQDCDGKYNLVCILTSGAILVLCAAIVEIVGVCLFFRPISKVL